MSFADKYVWAAVKRSIGSLSVLRLDVINMLGAACGPGNPGPAEDIPERGLSTGGNSVSRSSYFRQ